MANFSNKDKETLSNVKNIISGKVTALGADGYSFEEPFPHEPVFPLGKILRSTPDGNNDGYGLIAPHYDDYPSAGSIGTRYTTIRLHSYIPSGLSGPDSCQAFFAVSSAPASNSINDIDAVRIKPLISSAFSPGRQNAADTDPSTRGFELALYPAQDTAGTLTADTSNGPISPLADPSAASSSNSGAGAGSEGFWTVDYDNGIVRFSKPPLSGSTGVMNPNNVFGDISGATDASGAITMFATFYKYDGEFGVEQNPDVVTVGDGYVSTGQFYGNDFNVLQAAINSLPDEGGTVFVKEGQYDYVDSVVIPAHVNVIGLGGVTITRPRQEPVFIFEGDGYSSVEGFEIHTRDGINNGACIELRSSSASQIIRQVTIKNNVLYAENDAPAIAFAPPYNCTYIGLNINNNTFKSSTSNPVYIGEVSRGGTVNTVGMIIDRNDFQLNDSSASTAIKFDSAGSVVASLSGLSITHNNCSDSDITISIGADLDGALIDSNRIDAFSVTGGQITSSVLSNNIISTLTCSDTDTLNMVGNIVTTNNTDHPATLYVKSPNAYGIGAKGSGEKYGVYGLATTPTASAEAIVSGMSQAAAMDIDTVNRRLYWSDAITDRIYRSNMDGSGVEIIVTGLSAPIGIAVDIIDDKIYWGESTAGVVKRSNTDGTGIETIASGYSGINDVAVDIIDRKIYWAYSGGNLIYRSNLNGTSVEIFAASNDPWYIIADIYNKKIYWSEEPDNTISRMNIDKTGKETIASGTGMRGLAIDHIQNKLYWANNATGIIRRSDLDGSNIENVSGVIANLFDVALDLVDGNIYYAVGTSISRISMGRSIGVDGYSAASVGHGIRGRGRYGVVGEGNVVGVKGIGGSGDGILLDGYGVGVHGFGGINGTGGFFEGHGVGDGAVFRSGDDYAVGVDAYGSKAGIVAAGGSIALEIKTVIPNGVVNPLDVAIHEETGKLYWAEQGIASIRRSNTDGTEIETILSGLTGLTTLTLDARNNKIYYNTTSAINRANLDGTGAEVVLSTSSVQGIAIDTYRDIVYWTTSASVISLDLNSNKQSIIFSGGAFNRPIVIDEFEDTLYWADYGPAYIYKHDLRNETSEIIVDTKGPAIYGLCIDKNSQKLYWTNTDEKRVYRSNTDGTNVETLLDGLGAGVYGIDIDTKEGVIYWCEISVDKIRKAYIGRSIGVDASSTSSVGIGVRGSGYYGMIGEGEAVGVKGVGANYNDTDGYGIGVYGVGKTGGYFSGRGTGTGLVGRAGAVYGGAGVDGYGTLYGVKGTAFAKDGWEVEDGDIIVKGLDGTLSSYIDIDPAEEKIYWSEYTGGTIKKSDLDGSNVTTILTGLSGPGGISLDLVNRKIYWADDTDADVKRASLDGTGTEVVLSGLLGGYDVVVDPYAEKIYGVDLGIIVYSAGLNGENYDELYVVNSGIGETINSITVDFYNEKIYMFDGSGTQKRVDRINTDGSGYERLLFSGDPSWFVGARTGKIDHTTGHLYITSGSIINRVNLDGTGHVYMYYGLPSTIHHIALDTERGFIYATSGSEITRIKMNKATGVRGVSNANVGIGVSGSGHYGVVGEGTSVGVAGFGGSGDGSEDGYGIGVAGFGGPDGPGGYFKGTGAGSGIASVSGLNHGIGVDGYGTYIGVRGIGKGLPTVNQLIGPNLISNSHVITIGPDKLYYTDPGRQAIIAANLDGTNEEIIISGTNAYGLALDTVNGKIYWTVTGGSQEIHRANLNGSGEETIISAGLSIPYGIAVDPRAGVLYWAEDGNNVIRKSTLNGNDIATITTVTTPFGLALDEFSRVLYWYDSVVGISKVNIDGTGFKTIISTSYVSGTFNCVAIDSTGRKLYFSNAGSNAVQRSNLDGTNIETLFHSTEPRGIALDTKNGYLYWIEGTDDKIYRATFERSIGVDGRGNSNGGIGVRGIGYDGVHGLSDGYGGTGVVGVGGGGDGYGGFFSGGDDSGHGILATGIGRGLGAIIRAAGSAAPLRIVPQKHQPPVSNALKGDLYVRDSDGALMIFNGSAWVVVGSQS